MCLLRISASWLRSSAATVSPESTYSPEVGVSRQPRMFMRVDLPEPEGPTTATYSLRADLEVDAAQRLHRSPGRS